MATRIEKKLANGKALKRDKWTDNEGDTFSCLWFSNLGPWLYVVATNNGAYLSIPQVRELHAKLGWALEDEGAAIDAADGEAQHVQLLYKSQDQLRNKCDSLKAQIASMDAAAGEQECLVSLGRTQLSLCESNTMVRKLRAQIASMDAAAITDAQKHAGEVKELTQACAGKDERYLDMTDRIGDLERIIAKGKDNVASLHAARKEIEELNKNRDYWAEVRRKSLEAKDREITHLRAAIEKKNRVEGSVQIHRSEYDMMKYKASFYDRCSTALNEAQRVIDKVRSAQFQESK